MGLKSAPRTILRFVAVVAGLYFVVGLALLLLVVAVRTAGGHYPIPSGIAEPLADFATLLSTLLGAWFLVEGYSLKKLFAFAVSVWTLFVLPLLIVGGIDAVFGPFSVDPTGAGAFVVLVGVVAYLVGYRLVYPTSFAEQKQKFGFST